MICAGCGISDFIKHNGAHYINKLLVLFEDGSDMIPLCWKCEPQFRKTDGDPVKARRFWLSSVSPELAKRIPK